MQLLGSSGLFRILAACCVGLCGFPALAASTPSFTIAATNVTLPSGKTGATTQVTLTSVNGYSGTLVLNCQYAGAVMGARSPNCGGGTARAYPLGAGQAVTGSLPLYPYGMVVPTAMNHPPGWLARDLVISGVGLSGLFMLGLGTVHRARRRILQVLALVALAGVVSCGGNGSAGTFPFTVTAADTKTQVSVSTTITVTVP